jgi:hypothetical protein
MGFLDRFKIASPPEWRPDPSGRHQFRWWNGREWTEQVATDGVVSTEIVKGSMAYTVASTSGRLDDVADSVDFHALPFDYRVRRDVAAYSEPERFARVFGATTMPADGLRVWVVAGESHRQENLAAIAGLKSDQGVWCERVAELRPEPDNPYDGNAVAVLIDGLPVGYLPRREAATHRRLIDRATAQHGAATCGAVINGGWSRSEEGSEGSYGVRLYFGYRGRQNNATDLPDPLSDEERIPYRLDDMHDHINVTGEEQHQDTVMASLRDDWAGDHPFRLVELGAGTDPKGREAVQVSLDDGPVGWLTPKMTARFLPAVEAAIAQGRRLTACATLAPSKRKGCEQEVDVILRVPRGWGASTG